MPKLSVGKCQHSIWASVATTNWIPFRLLGYMVRAWYSYIYMTNSIILLNTSDSIGLQRSLMCFGQNPWEKSPVGQANNAQSHAKKESHQNPSDSHGNRWGRVKPSINHATDGSNIFFINVDSYMGPSLQSFPPRTEVWFPLFF